jgi:hypothetical protein
MRTKVRKLASTFNIRVVEKAIKQSPTHSYCDGAGYQNSPEVFTRTGQVRKPVKRQLAKNHLKITKKRDKTGFSYFCIHK